MDAGGELHAVLQRSIVEGAALRGDMGWPMAIVYWVVQCVAAIAGASRSRRRAASATNRSARQPRRAAPRGARAPRPVGAVNRRSQRRERPDDAERLRVGALFDALRAVYRDVDAAYAGTAAILPEFRYVLKGAELADSLVFNPHKWLFTPVDISVLYTRRPAVMRQAVALADVPPYLTASDRAVNLSDYALPLGRRFRSLKLWFVLRSFGREGIARVLRDHMASAKQITDEMQQDPRFEIVAPTVFSLVCFRYRGTDEQNRVLLDAVNATHQALLSSTILNGMSSLGNSASIAARLAWPKVSLAWMKTALFGV